MKKTLKENHKFPDRELFSVGGTRMSGWWCWVQGRVGRTSGEISPFPFFRPFWWHSIFSLSLFHIFTFTFSFYSFWWDVLLSLFLSIHSGKISYFHFHFFILIHSGDISYFHFHFFLLVHSGEISYFHIRFFLLIILVRFLIWAFIFLVYFSFFCKAAKPPYYLYFRSENFSDKYD